MHRGDLLCEVDLVGMLLIYASGQILLSSSSQKLAEIMIQRRQAGNREFAQVGTNDLYVDIHQCSKIQDALEV